MATQQKDNTGAIFVNARKEKDTHPDRAGTATIDGVEYWISGWLNESKGGVKYMSLQFKKKEENNSKPAPKPKTNFDNFDDDIPF